MKVVVASLRPNYFDSSGLVGALKRFCGLDVTLLTNYPKETINVYNWSLPRKRCAYIFELERATRLIEECDLLVICGLGFILHMFRGPQRARYNELMTPVMNARKIMIVSDAAVFEDIWSEHLKNYEQIYALPSLFHYLKSFDPKPIYHTNWAFAKPRSTNGRLVIGHSPGHKRETDRKGTQVIREVVESLDYELQVIEDMSHEDCVCAKAKMDIFIEQFPNINAISHNCATHYNLPPYLGSLGKSGQEGMCTGCATITSGEFADTDGHFPFPPVIIANTREKLQSELSALVTDRNHLKNVQWRQYEWAKKYLDPSFVAHYLMKDYL